MTQLLPPKKEVALALLEKSNVDVYLDPRAKGVVVPPQFLREPRLILKIGLNMPVPIHDLHLDDETLACTLSFSRTPFYCVVPWGSVFAMVGEDGRGMVWPDDVPQELAVRVVEDRPPAQLEAVESKPASAPASSGRGRGKKQAAAAPEAAAPTPPAAEAKRGKKSKKSAKNEGAKDKKEERPRPVLVAVPPAAPSEPELTRIPAARPDRQRVAKEAPRAPATVPQRAPTPSRPKRELPPYLRVVK